ncbi:uncharacterized protein BO80DRAFT_36808 [Aspergillus ibericus CBS 121593]|uniref:Uncharacterized protein n=1 Tax=Aspergillus ibericus CBS 121593 TaxID=1448316 RepID=A0A395H8G8_9EURO|nr:hypothetical protein BO80DRAFT_36808 [Aspergillus ibericus CBS 121593]RAL02514.1 hypothetical protein BO80DRAFT_36808 [Aspergillus ibericus CBS 121593]
MKSREEGMSTNRGWAWEVTGKVGWRGVALKRGMMLLHPWWLQLNSMQVGCFLPFPVCHCLFIWTAITNFSIYLDARDIELSSELVLADTGELLMTAWA